MVTDTETMTAFKYEPLDLSGKPKVTKMLGRGGNLSLQMQIVSPQGGETNLHAHTNGDACWLVLKGRARFYGYGDTLIADAGPLEGVFIPKGVPYWFDAGSDENLEILHITARDPNAPKGGRIDYSPPTGEIQQAQGGRPATDEERAAAARTVPPRA